MARIGFIGLGVMGFPMAGHLSAAGDELSVFNRTPSKSERWLETHQGRRCESPRELADGNDYVISCVGDDNDLRAITVGDAGAFETMKAGSIFIDHSTTSATVARELSALAAERGVGFIDAPVSGGQSGAERGALTVMCGGDSGTFGRAEPVMRAYAKACELMGPAGSGQLTKMVNQICIAGLLQGLSEGLNFGLAAGLDMDKVIAVISHGAAQSWQLDNRAKTMCDGQFDFGFAVDWMRKDLNIVLEEAAANGAPLPVTTIVNDFYAELQKRGANRWDTSALIDLLKHPSTGRAA